MNLSSTTIGGKTHNLSLYKHSSGAWVFGAGTVQWSWGLDEIHDRGNAPADARLQQATINLLADMTIQPATIQSGLTIATASTDVTAPVTTIVSPANNAVINSLMPIILSGTSTDAKTIVGVEISFDGGLTWATANGTSNWNYTWTPPANGSYTIKVRAFDDSGNFTTAAASATTTISFSAALNCPCTLFGSVNPSLSTSERDNTTGIVLGMKFRTSVNGTVTGIRFYKASGNSGTHKDCCTTAVELYWHRQPLVEKQVRVGSR